MDPDIKTEPTNSGANSIEVVDLDSYIESTQVCNTRAGVKREDVDPFETESCPVKSEAVEGAEVKPEYVLVEEPDLKEDAAHNSTQMLRLGDQFESFDEFDSKLKEYEKAVFSNYWIRDSRTLLTQSRRYPESVSARASSELKYYYFRIACIKGGRGHVPRNTQRQTLTFRQGCPAGMFLKLSSCGAYLELLEINEEHNHAVSETLFRTLRHQRLNSPEHAKPSPQDPLESPRSKKVARNKIRQDTAGCSITLKDLSNLGERPKSRKEFKECLDILRHMYNCDVKTLRDSDENLLCLYFQDVEMRKMFEAYPQIIFLDATYCLDDSGAAAYLVIVEDSEGNGVVVAAGILLNDDGETIDWFINQFKESNPNASEIKVIMSDKDSKERAFFKKSFPDASLQICLFRTVQIFNKEVSQRNMRLTNEECETARHCLASLAYAASEDEFEEEYRKTKVAVPKVVWQYYKKNWDPIKDQWVLYLTFNSRSVLDKANSKLESVSQKLKAAITRFSNLEEFIKNFFVCVNSIRVNRNISSAVHFHKVSTNLFSEGSAEDSYNKFLTNYAFEKVQQQMGRMDHENFVQMLEDDKCLARSSEGDVEVTTKSCQCLFWTSMGLPCRHILKFRMIMDLPLFDESLCLGRWTRNYFEAHHPLLNTGKANTSNAAKTKSTKLRALTSHKKFKVMNDECLQISKLCSEVSSDVFYERLQFIRNLVKKWSNGDDDKVNRDERPECDDECGHDVKEHHNYSKPYQQSENVGLSSTEVVTTRGRPKDGFGVNAKKGSKRKLT